jgi:hypothetical protein
MTAPRPLGKPAFPRALGAPRHLQAVSHTSAPLVFARCQASLLVVSSAGEAGSSMDDHGTGQQSGGGGRSKRCRFLTLAVVLSLAPVAVSFFFALNTALAWDQNLLQNGGFEQGTSGWGVSPGATFITVTEPVSSGNWAAALKRSDTTGWIWIYQDVVVVPGATYTLTGWIYNNEPRFDEACLRIEWVGSGSPDVQKCLFGNNAFYRAITVGPVSAPPDASKARIKALADIRTANPPNPLYFDELRLTSNMMPIGFLPLSLKSYPR